MCTKVKEHIFLISVQYSKYLSTVSLVLKPLSLGIFLMVSVITIWIRLGSLGK